MTVKNVGGMLDEGAKGDGGWRVVIFEIFINNLNGIGYF